MYYFGSSRVLGCGFHEIDSVDNKSSSELKMQVSFYSAALCSTSLLIKSISELKMQVSFYSASLSKKEKKVAQFKNLFSKH